MLQIIKLVIIIMNISYFLGMLWFIFCDLIGEIQNANSYANNSAIETIFCQNENFLCHFEIYNEQAQGGYENNETRIAITMMYFAFTSLSTVGFGDYHPRSD